MNYSSSHRSVQIWATLHWPLLIRCKVQAIFFHPHSDVHQQLNLWQHAIQSRMVSRLCLPAWGSLWRSICWHMYTALSGVTWNQRVCVWTGMSKFYCLDGNVINMEGDIYSAEVLRETRRSPGRILSLFGWLAGWCWPASHAGTVHMNSVFQR